MDTPVSLLDRICHQAVDADWQRLDHLYRPLIRSWILRDPTLRDDADDLVQDVLIVLMRELPGFQRQRTGSFRRWLRLITVNQVKGFWRGRGRRPRAAGGLAESPLSQLADPDSALSQLWDQEHDRHVLRRLLELIENSDEFEPKTLAAFRMVVFEETKPAEVARQLCLSVNAVLLAKSRVLRWLRKESEGLVD